MQLERVYENYWAAQHTNLEYYIGYSIVKVNNFDVTNRHELEAAKEQIAGNENVVFGLQKIHGRRHECNDDPDFRDFFG